jgi:hypothetical protein
LLGLVRIPPARPNASDTDASEAHEDTDLKAHGLLAAPGSNRPPTERSGDAARPSLESVPTYIEIDLKANERAWTYFEQLSPSYRRACIGWIDSAKRDDTRRKRLREVIRL